MKFAIKSLLAVSLIITLPSYANSVLDKIKESQTVNLGVWESSGLSYAIGNNKYAGFHTEMGENIVNDIASELGLESINIIYQPVTAQNRIPLLQNGTVDFECGATTNTQARQNEVDFANTTYVEEVRIAVKADSGIKTLADLNDKTIATTTGTTTVQTLRKNKRAEGLTFKEINGKDHSDSFLFLVSGRADAFVMDGSILAGNISKSKNPKDYIILDEVLSVEPIACMLPKGDTELAKLVNKSIARQVADGTLEKLYEKWFILPTEPNGTVIGLPLSESTKNAWLNPNNLAMETYN